MNDRVITKTRSILISQIFRKSFLLGPHEAKRSGATTLMSNEVEGVVNAIPVVHEAWASVLELILGVYSLSTVVSYSAFLIILPAAGR